jgi:hypothetical protein
MILKIRNPVSVAAIILVGLVAGRAEAAPQILGLVASNGMPTPLHCEDGLCTGFLASFCLQEARSAPENGADYRLAPGGGLTLVATMPDGRVVHLAATDRFRIRTHFRFTTVQIGLPEGRLDALGVRALHPKSLAIEVEPETTLLPIVAGDDPDPQSADEIDRASGVLRQLAAAIFDASGKMPDAVRLVSLLVNALPADDATGPVNLDRLLRRIVSNVDPNRLKVEAITDVEAIARSCQMSAAAPTSQALGDCLDFMQFNLLSTLNDHFWAAAGGS